MNEDNKDEQVSLRSSIEESIESFASFCSSSAIKVATGDLDLYTSNSPAICTRSQSLKIPAPESNKSPPTPLTSKVPKSNPPSRPDFKIPEIKEKTKAEMRKKNFKTRFDYTKANSETPPSTSTSTSSGSITTEPQEPCNPNVSSLRQVKKMNDKEMIEHLSKHVPELKDEAQFLYHCPEKIGLEPLRDILVNQTKTWRQSTIVIKALVVGLKAGLSYSLREQHRTNLEMFNDMRTVMTESSKLMTEVSQSLSETLKNEYKESGKTLSALIEVLGNAHELTKTLTEGKTHGHLQVPSKPKKQDTPEATPKQPENSQTQETKEPMTIKEKIKESMMSMERSNFVAYTDCKGDDIVLRTRVCGTNYNLTYDEKRKKWIVRKTESKDVEPEELTPYIDIFQRVARDKRVAKKPAFFAMGWFMYTTSNQIEPNLSSDDFWRTYYKVIFS